MGCRWADGWHSYLARSDDALHPYAVPGRSMRLAGLPRTLLVSAADDPLRDETQAFHHRLRAAGVPVALSLLEQSTGWPRSYLREPGEPGNTAAPWAAPLGARLRDFLSESVPTSTHLRGSLS